MGRIRILPILVVLVIASAGVTAADRDIQSQATASFAALLDQYRYGDAARSARCPTTCTFRRTR
jgi:hypothetical protein